MALGMSDNLTKRIVSALLLLPVVLWPIYTGGVWFTALLALGGALMMLEWCGLVQIEALWARALALGFVLLLVLDLGLGASDGGQILQALLVTAAAGFLLLVLKSPQAGWWFVGIGYVGMPLVALSLLRTEGAMMVFWVFLVVWATDVGGYFAGKGIGGPKMAPKVSPNKTWAGLMGGMALSAAVGLVLHYWFGFGSNAFLIAFLGAILAVWAQVGDLVESGIKRHFGVKDSGGLIPGHGGLLDRVDGLVFVAPAVVGLFVALPFLGIEF